VKSLNSALIFPLFLQEVAVLRLLIWRKIFRKRPCAKHRGLAPHTNHPESPAAASHPVGRCPCVRFRDASRWCCNTSKTYFPGQAKLGTDGLRAASDHPQPLRQTAPPTPAALCDCKCRPCSSASPPRRTGALCSFQTSEAVSDVEGSFGLIFPQAAARRSGHEGAEGGWVTARCVALLRGGW